MNQIGQTIIVDRSGVGNIDLDTSQKYRPGLGGSSMQSSIREFMVQCLNNDGDQPAVTPESCLGIASIYSAVSLYANTFYNAECNLKQKKADGNVVDATSHHAYRLSRFKANKFLEAAEFQSTMVVHSLLYHGGYAEIVRDGNGRAVSFTPLDPRDIMWGQFGGELFYFHVVKDKTGIKKDIRPIAAKNMYHLKNWSLNAVTGVEPIQATRDSIGLMLSLNRMARRYYASNGGLSGFFIMPSDMSPEYFMNWASTVSEQTVELEKGNFKFAPLFGDAKYVPVSSHAKDADIAEILKLTPREVCRIFRIPPGLMAIDGSVSYNSQSEATHHLRTLTFQTPFKRHQNQLNDKVLTQQEWESGEYYHEIDVDSVIAGDPKAKQELILDRWKAGGCGWKEMRTALGKPHNVDDIFLMPNVTAGSVLFNPSEGRLIVLGGNKNTDGESDNSQINLCENFGFNHEGFKKDLEFHLKNTEGQLEQLVTRLCNSVNREAKKGVIKVIGWFDVLKGKEKEFCGKKLQTILEFAGAEDFCLADHFYDSIAPIALDNELNEEDKLSQLTARVELMRNNMPGVLARQIFSVAT